MKGTLRSVIGWIHQNSIMTKTVKRFLSIMGVIIAGISMVAVFNNANAISNQTLNATEVDQGNYIIGLFVNMAITFIIGGFSLKTLLDNMEN